MPGALGVLLSPVYYHKKGALWACEQAFLQMPSSENINAHRIAALLFKGKRDERDARPVAQCCGAVRCSVRPPRRTAAACGVVVQCGAGALTGGLARRDAAAARHGAVYAVRAVRCGAVRRCVTLPVLLCMAVR